MSGDITFTISIPSDDDSYILLQCEYCGSFFKITVDDYNGDSIVNLYCPSCGLISDSYLTKDVIGLAETMVENHTMNTIYNSVKSMERATRHSTLQVKAGKKPKPKSENPIKAGIDTLEIKRFKCCNKTAKVRPLLKLTGCYCPFCGVRSYETE